MISSLRWSAIRSTGSSSRGRAPEPSNVGAGAAFYQNFVDVPASQFLQQRVEVDTAITGQCQTLRARHLAGGL